jgi:integrase
MKGHVRQRGGRFYAVIYEGLDPVTGREIRRWYPAGTDRGVAERLAARLAKAEEGRSGATRSLTFGAYLVRDWLPTKKLRLAATTYAGYERNVQRHVVPALGRTRLRRLTHGQINALYDRLLAPSDRLSLPRPSTRSTSSSVAR